MNRKYYRAWFAFVCLMWTAAAAAQTSSPASTAPTAVQTVQIPAADFARPPFIRQPRISPDGTHLAGMVNIEGKQVVAMLNLFDHTDHPVYILLPDNTEMSWLRWVNNDHLLVGVYALLPVEDDGRWVISRLVSIDRKTKKVAKILWDQGGQNSSNLLWVASDGSPNILVGAQSSIYVGEGFWPTVWKVDVETGKRSAVVKGRDGVMDWSADSNGLIRTGVSYNDSNRRFKLLYRGADGGNFKTIDTADTKKEEALLSPFLFMPGTTHALAMHDNQKNRSAIYEVDLLTQNDVRTVYTAPEGSEVDDIYLSADGSTLLGASYAGENTGIAWFDPALSEIQSAIDKSVPNRRARIVSMSADRSRLLVVIDRPDSPGALYYFDTHGAKMQRIAFFSAAFASKPLNPVKLIHYTARDGLKIEAVLTLPRDRPATRLPVIMLPHGGPWAQDSLGYDYWAQFFASRGYAVVQPNFRGSTGYGSAFVRAGQGQMGLAMQDDITDGLNWAVKEGIADPKRACIVGASYGGYAAMWGVAKDPDLYRCAISIAGVANLRREVNDFGDNFMGGKYRDDWKRMTPDFAAVSPLNAIDRIKVPVQLIHGKKDITVDYSQSSAMFGKMKGAGKVVELVPIPEADHHFTREADRLTLLTAMESFLLRYNPPDPPSPPAK